MTCLVRVGRAHVMRFHWLCTVVPVTPHSGYESADRGRHRIDTGAFREPPPQALVSLRFRIVFLCAPSFRTPGCNCRATNKNTLQRHCTRWIFRTPYRKCPHQTLPHRAALCAQPEPPPGGATHSPSATAAAWLSGGQLDGNPICIPSRRYIQGLMPAEEQHRGGSQRRSYTQHRAIRPKDERGAL